MKKNIYEKSEKTNFEPIIKTELYIDHQVIIVIELCYQLNSSVQAREFDDDKSDYFWIIDSIFMISEFRRIS